MNCHTIVRFGRWTMPLAMLLCCGAQGVLANWTIIGKLPAWNGRPRPIASGYFWDERHGLVGSGTGNVSNASNSPPPAIFYCDDGVNWIESNHPACTRGAEVSRILMRDSMV